MLMRFTPEADGQGFFEYALIISLVAIIVIVILVLLVPAIGNIFSNVIPNLSFHHHQNSIDKARHLMILAFSIK